MFIVSLRESVVDAVTVTILHQLVIQISKLRNIVPGPLYSLLDCVSIHAGKLPQLLNLVG